MDRLDVLLGGRVAEEIIFGDVSTGAHDDLWVAEGAAPAPPAVSLAEIPWGVTRLQGGEVVHFSQMAELPETDAAVDRRTYLKLGIKSQVAVPLRGAGGLLGALTFSSLDAERSWPDDPVSTILAAVDL